MALSIVTLNANGLRDQSKRAGLLQWFRTLTVVPDIVCLQECHCSSDLECQTWFRASGYLCALAAGSTHARGCIILFRPTLSLVQSWSEPDGRFLMCEFRFCNQVFRVCCVYAPNSNPQRNQFLDDVSVRSSASGLPFFGSLPALQAARSHGPRMYAALGSVQFQFQSSLVYFVCACFLSSVCFVCAVLHAVFVIMCTRFHYPVYACAIRSVIRHCPVHFCVCSCAI